MSADLADFLAHFRPDGHTTFVGIAPDGSTVAETFNGADPGKAGAWVEAQNRARGVYFTVNPTPADLRKKPTKADINAIAGLWSDIDPQESNRDEWLTERKRLLTLADELMERSRPPTLIIDSGSGVQPVWLLADPIEMMTEYREAAETLCARLEAVLGASGTHNVDWLLRVPGTTNFPNQKKRDLGRDRTQALLLHATWQRYTWRDLEALVKDLEASSPRSARPLKRSSKPRTKPNGSGNGHADTLPPYRDKATIEALLQDPTAAAYWHQSRLVEPAEDRTASGWDLAFAGYLARTGRGRLEIAALLRAYRAHHAPAKSKQDRADYIFATTDQAIGDTEDEDETFTSDSERMAGDEAPRQEQPRASRRYSLEEVHEVFRRWLGDEYDIATLNAALAAAAAERLPGDPLWLLVISGPGNAKTETVQALRGAGAHITSTIASEGAALRLVKATARQRRNRRSAAQGRRARPVGSQGCDLDPVGES